MNYEVVLKALSKITADKLTFNRAIEVAIGTEDAAKVAKKKNVFGSVSTQVHKVKSFKQAGKKMSHLSNDKTIHKCYRCGKATHFAPDCRFKTGVCNYCQTQEYLKLVCRKKISLQKPGTFQRYR